MESDKVAALRKSVERCREDVDFVQQALDLANRRVRTLLQLITVIEAQIRGIEYDHYRDDDSPKGETVPGVRFGTNS